MVVLATTIFLQIDVKVARRWFSFLTSALSSLYGRLSIAFRMARMPWRSVEVCAVKSFPTTVGFFEHCEGEEDGGEVQHYYRFPSCKRSGGKLMRLTPTGGVGFGEDFQVTWSWTQIISTSCGESALSGAKYTKVLDQSLWKGTFKVTTSTGTYDSMGLNISGCALVAGHALRNREYVVLVGSNSMTAGVKVATSRFVKPAHYFEGSGTDFGVALLTGNEWAMIGAKSLSAKDFTSPAVGSADLQFGVGADGVMHLSEGSIPQQPKAAEQAGLVLTKVSSESGASGGAVRRFVGGVPKYMAFHIARPADSMSRLEGKYNVAISFDLIFSFMREHGLYHDPVYAVLKKVAVGESLDYDLEKEKEPLKFQSVDDECYGGRELWERTQERIEQQVCGDEWTKHDTGRLGRRAMRGLDDGAGESAVPAPPGLVLPSPVDELENVEFSSCCGEDGSVCSEGDDTEDLPRIGESVPEEEFTPAQVHAIGMGCKLAFVAALFASDFDLATVKRQVINADFSFVSTLKDAVSRSGVSAVHDYVINSDSFAVYRDYMNSVQPFWAQYDDSLPDENGAAFFDKVGEFRVDGVKSATTPDRKKKAKPLNEVAKERSDALRALIKDLGCEDEDWVTPENTRANIFASMAAHAALADVRSPPATQADWERALEVGCEDFDTTVLPTHLEQGFEGWYKLAATMADSSSGVSARFRAQSKKQWAADPQLFLTLVDLIQCRLILMIIHEDVVSGYTPEQCVRYGLKDVLLLSVKGEPHAPKKAKLKRFRMIWINSLVDCFVQKLLHKALNARDIENYQSGAKFHSAAGMGHHDEGIQHLCAAFDSMFEGEDELLTCDASMWDFTMHKEAHLNHARRRCLSCKDPVVQGLIMTLAHLNYKHLCECKGDVWRCNKEGVNTSGQSSTTADNTFTRHSQAKVCGATKVVSNGDDMVADKGFDPVAAAKFGTKSRDVVLQRSDVVPFTSHHVDRKTCTASYDRPVKLAWNLLANCGSTDFGLRVDAMLSVIRNTPDALAKFKEHVGKFAQGSGACNKDLLWAI